MRFITDDDLKVCGKVWIALYPRAKLRVGGYDRFIGTVFFTKWQMGCARVLLEKHIGAGQGFVLCQTQVAVLGVDKKKCFVRRRCQCRDGIDGGSCFAAAAGRDNQIECAALERGWG